MFTNLGVLQLNRNKLVTLPLEIFKETKLRVLTLSHNNLVTLPPEIGNLKSLTTLNLAINPLTTLPEEMDQLTNLQSLGLSNATYTNLRETPLRSGVFADLIALDKILGVFNKEKTEEAFKMFKKLPIETKKGIYEELYKLLPLQNKYDGCAEHAFLKLYGQDTGDALRQQAIQNFIRK